MNRLRLLTRGQRRLFLPILLAGGLLIANSAYLALATRFGGIGEQSDFLPLSYQINLLIHVVVGLLLVVPVVVFVVWHLPRTMKGRKRGALPSGVFLAFFGLVLFATGLFIFTAANSQSNLWVFLSHQIAAALLPLIYLAHRLMSRDRLQRQSFVKGFLAMLVLVLVAGLVHFLELRRYRESRPEKPVVVAEVPEVWKAAPWKDPFVPFTPAGFIDPESPFFPSGTTTATGGFLPSRIIHHDDFPDREAYEKETRERGFSPNHYLGAQTCQRCHPDIVEQWATSVHRFASFNNPFYRKAVELTREAAGKKASQFCGGCHDPAIMLAGNMTKEIDPVTLESQAALTCLACHAIDKIHNQTGNGNYNIQDEVPSAYLGFSSKGGLLRQISDALVKSKPTVHKRRMLKPFFRESLFCAACHKVNLDVPINGYKWLRGQNEYDAWHNSGVMHNNPMTWYEPKETQTCQDCHMPMEEAPRGDVSADSDGKVRSHRFLSVNTALPSIRGDEDTLRRIREGRKNSLRVDVFAVHRADGSKLMALDDGRATVQPGEEIQVDVVVRNKGVGHTFPGGTNDSNQGWIDFEVVQDGKTIYRSGGVDEARRVDPAAHFYKAVLVDKHSQRINKRNAQDIHATVYANVIGPSTSDIARYRFRVPEGSEGQELQIRARVMWRKFNREYVEFVYEGKEVPEIPIDEVSASSARLRVAAKGSSGEMPKDLDWTRVNDYGVGLFLDGDTAGAREAFRLVAMMVPERPDGWRNQARALLRDGNLAAAEEFLRKASQAAPQDPKTTFFWGRWLESSGQLERAVEAYRQTLEFYPDSRDSWRRLGQTYWRMGRYEDCLKAFLEVLRIDPEDANAHHKRLLVYGALAKREADPKRKAAFVFAEAEARKAYLKYKIDETAPEVTKEYRLSHPHDNLMSQRIVIHELKSR